MKEIFITDGRNLFKILRSKILNKLLQQCINEYFPEFKEQEIKIGYTIVSHGFGGTKAGKWIVLFLPDIKKIESPSFKWIVIHELCHFIDLHNPDMIFKEKVPKDVWEMWRKLEARKELICDGGQGIQGSTGENN